MLLGYYIFLSQIGQGKESFVPNPSQRSGYSQIAQMSLGQVDVKNYQRMGFTRGIVRFSPDGKWLGVGTETGQLLLLDNSGRLQWSKSGGLGKLISLEFSTDGKSIYVGENSAEGALYCLEAATGREVWRLNSVNDIGGDIRRKSNPGIVRIISDKSGMIYALAQRHEKTDDGQSVYKSKIYCLNPAGKKQWEFPAKSMDAWVNWMSVDIEGELLIFGTANFETQNHYEFDKNIYGIQASSGKQQWGITISTQPPYEKTILRGSPNLAADGRYLAAMASDGRAFLFDENGNEQWRRYLSQPKEISGVYLNALGRDAYIAGDRVIFATVNTYNSANWQLPTPVEHPSSNSLFLFNLSGDLLKKWQAGGSIDELALSSQLAVAAIGRNTKTKDPSVHGLALLRLSDGEMIDRFRTEGPCIAAAVSPDGRFAAGIEAPIQTDTGTIVGAYRLHLLRNVEQ